jgi:hypothetical protein
MKEKELDPGLDFDLEKDRGKHIIDTDLNATITTTKFQPKELEEPKKVECLFDLHMWLKGIPLHFIIDSGS